MQTKAKRMEFTTVSSNRHSWVLLLHWDNFVIDLLLSTSSWLSVTVFESKDQRTVLYFCLVIRLLIIHTLFWLLEIFLMFFCNWVWRRMQLGTSPSLQECLWSGWRMVCYSYCSLFLRRKQRTYRKSSILLGIDQCSQDVLRWVWGSQNRESTDPAETNRWKLSIFSSQSSQMVSVKTELGLEALFFFFLDIEVQHLGCILVSSVVE